METSGNLLTSPVGQIHFMAVARPVLNAKGDNVYSIRLAFDSTTDADWIAKIADINSSKPVTAATFRGKKTSKGYAATKAILDSGKTLISAETKFEVPVFDKEGNQLEDVPWFFEDSAGTAQMVVQPYTKSDKGGTINLVAVILHDFEGGSGGVDREAKAEQLRAVIAAATKGQ